MTDNSLQALQAQLKAREREIAAVHRISEALVSKTSLDALLRETLSVSLESIDADAGSLLLYDGETRKLVFRFVLGPAAEHLTGMEIDPEQEPRGNAATVFFTGESRITLDTRQARHDPRIDAQTGYHTDSILTVPLKSQGVPIGVIQAINKREGQFDAQDLELIEILGSLASTSLINASLAEQAQLAAVAGAVGDLGHDIKNALTPVETAVETLMLAYIEPMYVELDELAARWKERMPQAMKEMNEVTGLLREGYPDMLESVRDGCADIREMVGEIADYIKGTQVTYREVSSLYDTLKARLQRLQVVADQRHVTLRLECANDLPPFAFDKRLVGRAVFNLVNNALGAISDAVKRKTFTLPPTGCHIWVRARQIYGAAENPLCLLEVEDDGPGMPEFIKNALFTSQTISTTPGGTGIGTRFVKSVADAHDGTVGVESAPGKGARFWMILPIRASAQS